MHDSGQNSQGGGGGTPPEIKQLVGWVLAPVEGYILWENYMFIMRHKHNNYVFL